MLNPQFHLTPENLPYMYFSQYGEDLIAWMYAAKINGFFVDVGAFHPITYSNTFALYLRGWRGINIEPNPEPIAVFKELRPEDITLNMGISKVASELEYFSFNYPSGNTFDRKIAANILKNDSRVRMARAPQKIPTRPLKEVLDEYYPKDRYFDLLSIDAEGMDLDVLESSDWSKYRPELVFVEDHDFDMENPHASKIFQFMKRQGYTLFSKAISTLIFQESEAYQKRTKYAGRSHAPLPS